MKKLFYLLALAAGMLFITSCDEDDDPTPVVPVESESIRIEAGTDITTLADWDAATNTLTLKNENDYTINGIVYITGGRTLMIEPGTVIKAEDLPGDATTALVISQGAKIMAEGTMEDPIIMTSSNDDLNDPTDLAGTDNRLWGGLIVLGSAGISNSGSPTGNVEGIEPNPNTLFGGSNDADNSGVIKYVSIRHTGAALAPGDEIQGLTLGGVGSGTEIDYVEVFGSYDDGIEIFGGSVNIKHIACSFVVDDCFDLDQGWNGTGQFLFAVKGDAAGDHMAEWDGAKPDSDPRYTSATIANATFIGSGNSQTTNGDNGLGVLMRDGFGGKLFNSIIMGVNGPAIEVEDIAAADDATNTDSYSKFQQGTLQVEGNVFWVNKSAFDASDDGIINVTTDEGTIIADDMTASELGTYLAANNSIGDPQISITSLMPGANGINPIPGNTGLVTSNMASVSTPGIMSVNYKGAFDPSSSSHWLEGWTALSQNGYLPN
ncbi:MAG: hypothetical protein Kapaf2KO_10310 [Candidatus Kapaibacteriales bacterium]